MKLNEEEMYNAHPWLLTVPRVGIDVYTISILYQKLIGKESYKQVSILEPVPYLHP